MTDYPIEPGKLLEAAEQLAPAETGRGRPAYTFHRRAVSTAYYAVFHAITDRVVKAPFTEADVAFLRKVRRRLEGEAHIDDDTLTIADGFLELNEKREEADYDHDAVFTRPETLDCLALARDIVETVERTQTDAAKRFFGLVAMQADVRNR